MAVYTEVSYEDLAAYLAAYDVGQALELQGHRRGRRELELFPPAPRPGCFILTLYEKRVREADLPFFLGLMDHLASRGLACPLPVHTARQRARAADRTARRDSSPF